jgi:hypothetical protein
MATARRLGAFETACCRGSLLWSAGKSGFPPRNGSVYQTPLGTSFDPNGGYYYARVSFNF